MRAVPVCRHAMRAKLQEAFQGAAALPKTVIDTVERLQGQEADVVIVLYAFTEVRDTTTPAPTLATAPTSARAV